MQSRNVLLGLVPILALLSVTATAPAQAITDRIDLLKQRRENKAPAEPDPSAILVFQKPPTIHQRMQMILDSVTLDYATVRESFDWWSNVTGIPMMVDWEVMELEGIDPEQRIDVHLRSISAKQLLTILMRRTATPDMRLLYEASPYYVEVMTQDQANTRTELRIYDLSDLLYEIPHFTNPPRFDLENALDSAQSGNRSGGSSGGRSGGRGGSSGIFGDVDEEEEPVRSKRERGQHLAQLIRDTIEPTIWAANGGEHSSINYFNGRLIVRAPLYVHRQIGLSQSARIGNHSNENGNSANTTTNRNTFHQRTTRALQQRLAGKRGTRN